MKKLIAILGIFVAMASIGFADTITLPAVADPHWIAVNPDRDFGLIRWDVSKIPARSRINSAVIELNGYAPNPKTSLTVVGYLVAHSWTEGTGLNLGHDPWSGVPRDGASWLTYDGFDSSPHHEWGTPGGDIDKLLSISCATTAGHMEYYDPQGALKMDASKFVAEWVGGGHSNNGILLKCPNGVWKFKSREEVAPRLVIDYTAPAQ